ncbi:MAG TPA: GNAT family N-acetyltransferase [Gemmatimonadaceae bacterium]|nr:GNAT family N-acetyltransferase [Gemmatimonadaceae bacterium]
MTMPVPTPLLAPPPGMVVRVATPDDLETVVALRLQLLREEAHSPLFARPRRDAARQARLLCEAQLATPSEVSLLALAGGDGIGLLRCAVSRAPRLVHPTRYGFLTSAYVAPAYRRRGVLRALLREAEAWCRAHGLREVRLHCTVENAEGNATWEALGYAPAEVVRRRTLGNR